MFHKNRFYFRNAMDLFNDILFQHKNKAYGAYYLRKRYPIYVSIGLLIALITIFSISYYSFLWNIMNANKMADDEISLDMVMFENYNMMQSIDSFMISKPIPKKEVPKKEIQKIVVVDSVKPQIDTIKLIQFNEEKKEDPDPDSLGTATSSKDGVLNGSGDATIYLKVDKLPQFPGGETALMQFIRKNTVYPEEARKKNISGTVLVQFVVLKDGSIDKVSLKKGVHPLLDQESIRVVKMFPKFTPAKRKGYEVNFLLVMPFKYTF